MSSQIIYKNSGGQELTPQQLAMFEDDYTQETYVDDKLKRVDIYFNGKVNSGMYYLDSDENIQTILRELSTAWTSTLLFINENISGEFIMRSWELYNGTIKLENGQSVYDSLNREICEAIFNINTMEITQVHKKYYLNSYGSFIENGDVHDFGTFDFAYDSPGTPTETVRVWINLPGFDHKEYYITNQENKFMHFLIRPIFSWDDHLYYHRSTPLVPSSTL